MRNFCTVFKSSCTILHPNNSARVPISPRAHHHLLDLFFMGFFVWFWIFFVMAILTNVKLYFIVLFFFTIFFFKLWVYLFIYLWLCWFFISAWGLSPVVASGGHSSSRCTGLSLSWSLLLRSTGSRCAGSVVVAHGPSCSVACGIFPDQGSNLCPLHWQADSQPLCHQGSPHCAFKLNFLMINDVKHL